MNISSPAFLAFSILMFWLGACFGVAAVQKGVIKLRCMQPVSRDALGRFRREM